MENPVMWFNREIGRPSSQWKVVHWLAFLAAIAGGVMIVAFG